MSILAYDLLMLTPRHSIVKGRHPSINVAGRTGQNRSLQPTDRNMVKIPSCLTRPTRS